MKRSLHLLFALLLAGCAGQWVHMKAPADRALSTGDYTVTLPAGWVRRQLGDTLTVSRDGPSLQRIELRAVPADKAFPRIERGADAGLLPSELGARFIAELRATDEDGLPSLEIEEEGPARLAGAEGFRVLARFRDAQGLAFRVLAYGARVGDRYFELVYTAPALHYFDRDLDAAEAVRASLKAH